MLPPSRSDALTAGRPVGWLSVSCNVDPACLGELEDPVHCPNHQTRSELAHSVSVRALTVCVCEQPVPEPAFDDKCMSYWMNRQVKRAAWVRYREFCAEALQQREALMGATLKWLKTVTAATPAANLTTAEQALTAAFNTWYNWLFDMNAQRQVCAPNQAI